MGFQVAVARAGQKDGEMQALENLLRFLDGKNVKFSTVSAALLALQAAKSYHLLGFERHAANFLLANLHPSSVLKVLESAFPHSSLCNKEVLMGPSGNKKMKKDYKEIGFTKGRRGRAQSPGAPGHPLDLGFLGLEVEENEANAEQELFDQIAQRCLQLIDQQAEAVLQSEGWETTPLSLVTLILGRDSLKINNELPVMAAMDRWARMQCFLSSTSPSPTQKRRLLGPARLQARLLTMSPTALRRVQAVTGLLGPGELEACVKALLQPRCSCALPGELRGKRELLSRAREGHLHTSAPIPIRVPTSAPTRDPTPTSEGQEPDYASIVTVDDRLEEVGIGDYRWRRGQVGVWQRLDEAPRLREKRCTCAVVRHSYKQATAGGMSTVGGHPSSRRPSASNGRARRLRGGHLQARRRADPTSLACLFYCLACVFD